MSDESYCADMDAQRGVTTGLDMAFGPVRVTVDETLVVVVAEHGAHPHDIFAAGMYARELTAGREPCDFYGDEELDNGALILMFPRMTNGAFDLRTAPANRAIGVPL